MFRLSRLSSAEIDGQIAAANGSLPSAPRFLSLDDKLGPGRLGGFAHDRSRSCLGHGREAFSAAKQAFANWQMFDLGWVRVVNRTAQIACGQLVAVEVYALGLWTVNLSRVVETVDSENQFGLIYATTEQHVEQGEESFVIRFDPASGEVSYELEAVSRPRHILAQLGFPVTRFFQHRFARDSHGRMREAVNLNV